MSDLLLRELYWRHTKETVKGEYQIPDCVEDLVLMEFDEIEAALYTDACTDGTLDIVPILILYLIMHCRVQVGVLRLVSSTKGFG